MLGWSSQLTNRGRRPQRFAQRAALLLTLLAAQKALAQAQPAPTIAPPPPTSTPDPAAPAVPTNTPAPAPVAASTPAPVVVSAPVPAIAPTKALPPAEGPKGLRCLARCDRAFEVGEYRVLIDPTEHVSGGMARINIRSAGGYHVEGAPRDRRARGLLLASTGMILTGVGAGMMLGANAFKSGLTPREERWFWGGMATFGVGVLTMPLGFSLYGRSPKVSPMTQPSAVPLARGEAEMPRSYREPELSETEPPPPGSTTVSEPRWGLVMAGAITFASAYAIMAGVAVGVAANNDGSDPWRYSTALIPIFGPALVDRREGNGPILTIYGTMPELAGAIMMLIGATSTRNVLVKSDAQISLAPFVFKDAGGLSLVGAF